MQSIRNNRGFSLIQVVTFMGLAAIINAAVAQLIINQGKMQNAIQVKTSAMAIRQNLVGLISSHHSWQHTRLQQPRMTCAGGQGSGFCTATNPTGPKTEIQLYDATGQIFHDNGPTSGYTKSGEPCNTFNSAGSVECPIKFRVLWRANCTSGTCSASNFAAPEFITLELVYAPGEGASLTSLNPQNYGLVEQNRLTFTDQASPALDCAIRDMIFIGPNKVFNSLTADAQGCIDYAAFYGPRGDTGPRGPQGVRGPQGAQGPQGPRGRDQVCPVCPTGP